MIAIGDMIEVHVKHVQLRGNQYEHGFKDRWHLEARHNGLTVTDRFFDKESECRTEFMRLVSLGVGQAECLKASWL